jgi:uncharacterized protein (DUF1330 family)
MLLATGTHMPAYYIGEHKISNVALFDDYLAKVLPMVERFGGRYLTKAGSHEILEGDWTSNFPILHRSKIGTGHRNTNRSSHCPEAQRPT